MLNRKKKLQLRKIRNILSKTLIQQVCIPVGCVPPACCPYLSAWTVPGGVYSQEGVCSQGVSAFGPGGVCSGGLLPGGCLPLVWGRVCIPASNGQTPPVDRILDTLLINIT